MSLKKLILEGITEKLALQFLSELIKTSKFNGKVYLAGGAVRDEILGLDPKDIDLVVELPNGGIEFANWVCKKLNIYKQDSNPVIFERFGTAKFTLFGINYKGYDLSNIDIEVVMTRKERYSNDSRKPDVEPGTLKDDVDRRDFTVNSLLKDLSSGEILDLTGMGKDDIKKGIIRTPLDPNIIFSEDPLRIMRAIRFAVKYNWKLPYFMLRAIKDNAYKINNISSERIRDEFDKILMTDNAHKGIKLLKITGLTNYILPEFDNIVKMAQNKYHQWTVDKHTYETIKNTPKKLVVRLAALFHDLGKSKVINNIDGKITFHGHEQESMKIADDIMKRLKYPTDVITAVNLLVNNHMRTKQFGKNIELASDKSLRKLANDLGDNLENTLDLIHADNISHGDNSNNWEHNLPNQVALIKQKLIQLGDFTKKLNIPLNGTDILSILKQIDPNIKPGKTIGILLDKLKDKFLDNPNISKSEAEDIIKTEYKNIVL